MAGVARARNSVAYAIGAHGVNLPSGLNLERADVARVGAAVRAMLAERVPVVASVNSGFA